MNLYIFLEVQWASTPPAAKIKLMFFHFKAIVFHCLLTGLWANNLLVLLHLLLQFHELSWHFMKLALYYVQTVSQKYMFQKKKFFFEKKLQQFSFINDFWYLWPAPANYGMSQMDKCLLLQDLYTVNLKCLIPKRSAVTLFKCVMSLDFKHRNIHSIKTSCIRPKCFCSNTSRN